MVGVLLAAGAGTRMGRAKPLVRHRGESFLARAVRGLWTVCDDVVVVLGSRAAEVRRAAEAEFERLVTSGALHEDLRAAHTHGADGLEVQFTTHPRWRSGMLSSATLGLRTALARRPEAIVVMPVDHPHVRPSTYAALGALVHGALAACANDRERARFAYALVPRWRRRRGHPLVVTPALARAIVRDRAAADLSDAVRRNARLVGFLDLGDRGIVRNVNTPAGRRARS